MTAPLGFRRSTRKRLRRCEHARISALKNYHPLAGQDSVIVACTDCGAFVLADVEVGGHVNHPSVRHFFTSQLPSTIARRVPWWPV